MSLLTDLDEAVRMLHAQAGAAPSLAIVLGSGLGPFADTLTAPSTLPFEMIPHWPAASVVGHAGRLVVGTHRSGRRVAVLSGRVHLYEGHGIDRVVFGVRAMARWGVRHLLLTNAAGGINTAFGPGTLMVIEDHINMTGNNPLVGPNDERLGARFPDMTEVYAPALRQVARVAAADAGVSLAHGTYIGVLGPSYETPAEIRAFRTLGADVIGMSTVPEAIAAHHMGMEVAGLSCITNPAAGVLPEPLRHDEVMEVAARVREQFIALLDAFIARLPRGADVMALPATTAEQALVTAARAARVHAFAPFSRFAVGAALRLADGRIVSGCNVENATYGLTVCAERVALLKAVSEGARPGDFAALAVVATADTPTPPCGACRQLLWEFCGDVPVICVTDADVVARYHMAGLLPAAFDLSFLPSASPDA